MMKSLSRGVRVLQCFTAATPQLRLKDVADRLGIPMGSAFRTLATLEALGFVRQDATTKTYRLGLRALDLGHACLVGMVFPDVALPFLEELAGATGRSANMAVLDGDEIVFVARASITRLMSVNLSVGSRLPSHATAMGKVLLAHLDDETLAGLIGDRRLPRFTAATITDPSELRATIAVVRERGYAVTHGELEQRLSSFAAPVRDATGAVAAAINVALFMAPDEPVDDEAAAVPKLLQTAQVISSALGYRPGRLPSTTDVGSR